ncbi:MAG: hypothetical protein ACYTG4_11790 [Planctomycetota bacterium]
MLAVLLPSFAPADTIRDLDENFGGSGAKDAWIYNDLARGFEEARAAKKPMMVVYRCVP